MPSAAVGLLKSSVKAEICQEIQANLSDWNLRQKRKIRHTRAIIADGLKMAD